MDRIDNSETPIGRIKCLPVFLWESSIHSADKIRGRSLTDIKDWRHYVRKIIGPFAGAGAPSKFCTTGNMINPGGPIPGQAKIPFHVRVIGKQFSLLIECDVKCISKSPGDKFPMTAIRMETGNPACWQFGRIVVTPWIFYRWK